MRGFLILGMIEKVKAAWGSWLLEIKRIYVRLIRKEVRSVLRWMKYRKVTGLYWVAPEFSRR